MKRKKLMIYLVLMWVCLSVFASNVVSHEVNLNKEHVCTKIFVSDYQNDSLKDEKNVNKYALLIGIEDYPPGAKDLDYTIEDVYDMCDVLINNCYFDPENIRVLTDANATKENIQDNITWLASNAKENDTVLFLFSGHGGHNYVLAYGSTISDNELDLWFGDINSTNLVVIIDSCYAASMIEKSKTGYKNEGKNCSYIDGMKNANPKKMSDFAKGLGQDGRIVLAACDKNQKSWEYDKLSNGVFTYYLTEGLKSSLADTNGNGWVSVEEAFYYAKPRTYAFNDSDNLAGGQDPQIYDGIKGELNISSLTPTGDLIVDDTKTYSNIPLPLNKNLTITGTGNLTLNNVILMMNSSFNGSYHIEVLSGGQLYIYNSNITSANEYHYLFWVRNDSKFEMRDSELGECGWNWNNRGLTVEASNVHISNCTFSNNYCGIYFHYSLNNNITDCNISNNYAHGIFFDSSSNNIIASCEVSNNWHGMICAFSDNNTITKCNLCSNNNGVILTDSSNNTFTSCNIYLNHNDGFQEYRSYDTNLINCKIYSNGWGGITVSYGVNNTIMNSYIYSNVGAGIFLDNTLLYIISSNISANNWGIFSYSSSLIAVNTTMTNALHDIHLEDDSVVENINVTFNTTRVYFEGKNIINVSWYLNINVFGQDCLIDQVTIKIYNTNGDEIFSGYTNENGQIKEILLYEYMQNQTSITYYTPYTITASKNGYYGSATVDMNQSREIIIYLEEDKTPPNAEAGDDRTVDEDMEIELNAGLSSDNIGIINYTWGFADQGKQITLYGNTVKYNFIQPGFYTVTLNVSDKAGNHDTDIVNIAVKDATKPVIENVSTQITSYMNCKVECMVYDNVGVETVEISMDNHSWKKCVKEGNKHAEKIGLKSGNNTVYVRATDSSGNVNITSISVFVKVQEDTVPDFVYDAIIFIIILIFCMCLTIILEHKPKKRKGL